MRRVYKFLGLRVVVTDEDVEFVEDEEVFRLRKEKGWWTENGEIWIYEPGLRKMQVIGVGVHEFVESFLVEKLKMPVNWGHIVANVLEWIVAVGKPTEQVWRRN